MARQALNVFRMRMMGTKVVGVDMRARLRQWAERGVLREREVVESEE